MALPLGVLEVLGESLVVTSESTASGERSDEANLTILLSFAFIFSRAAVLQMFLRHLYLAEVFVIDVGCAYWKPSLNVVSLVLNRISVVTISGKD